MDLLVYRHPSGVLLRFRLSEYEELMANHQPGTSIHLRVDPEVDLVVVPVAGPVADPAAVLHTVTPISLESSLIRAAPAA